LMDDPMACPAMWKPQSCTKSRPKAFARHAAQAGMDLVHG
jgi:hypothetical protein